MVDLGCGDGRWLLAAARKFKQHGGICCDGWVVQALSPTLQFIAQLTVSRSLAPSLPPLSLPPPLAPSDDGTAMIWTKFSWTRHAPRNSRILRVGLSLAVP